MSLVNDMLNDLEQRRAAQPAQTENLEWLSSRAPYAKNSRRSIYLIIMALIGVATYVIWQQYTAKSSVDVASELLASSGENTHQEQVLPVKVAVPPMVQAKAKLEKVSFDIVGNETKITLSFDRKPNYQMASAKDELLVEIEGALEQVPININSVKGPITGVSFRADKNNFVIVFSLMKNIHYRSALATSTDKQLVIFVSRVEMPVANKEPRSVTKSAAKTSVPIVKEPKKVLSPKTNKPRVDSQVGVKRNAPLTIGEQDTRTVSKARELLTLDDAAGAQRLLSAFLAQYPRALYSNILSVEILLAQGQVATAQQSLSHLSHKMESSSELRRLQAHAYVLAENPALAVQLLLSKKPDIAAETAYYELLASAAQRAKQYELSAQVYKSLLRQDSGQGQWWLGLAISQELQGLKADARSNFMQAMRSGRMGQSLRDYAKRRYDALAGAVNVYPQEASEKNDGG